MRRFVELPIVAFALFLCLSPGRLAISQSISSNQHKILVDSLVVSGTQAIDSAELAEITGTISGGEFDDDSEELQERIRDAFQERGYIKAEVTKFEMKNIDPLGSPRPVRIEAEVNEGPLCRVSTIQFTGNHFFSTEELRNMFPLKTGDVFKKGKIANGLSIMVKAFGERGLLDASAVPEIIFSGANVELIVDLLEGPQYRMDKLEITGPTDVQQKLQLHWTLDPGAVFDRAYVYQFIDENHSLLPVNFVAGDGVKIYRDCKAATASVHIHLVQDAQHDAQDRGLTQSCPKQDDKQR